jgi:hypothetical protein
MTVYYREDIKLGTRDRIKCLGSWYTSPDEIVLMFFIKHKKNYAYAWSSFPIKFLLDIALQFFLGHLCKYFFIDYNGTLAKKVEIWL